MVFKWLMASRRAYADEYAVRVNRAVGLLVELSPADAVLYRALGREALRVARLEAGRQAEVEGLFRDPA